MLCKPCEDRTPGGSVTRRPRSAPCVTLCEQCGVTIIMLRGVRLGAGEGVAVGAGVAAGPQADRMARIAAVIETRGRAAGRRGAVTAAW